MSAQIKAAPRSFHSALQHIAASLISRVRWPQRKRLVPHDWREIERIRLEYELRRADVAIITRFKVM
ncbi:MAG: hypothetical protein ACJ8AS_12575 [Hyphomicrobiales bacterium]